MINVKSDLVADSIASKFYVGTVRVLDTARQLDRVRVHVPELMEGYPDSACPWAGISRPVLRGAGGAGGFRGVPRVGTRVLLIFDKGDLKSPIIIGELTSPSSQSGILGENYPNRYGWEDENGNYFYFDVSAQTMVMGNQGATVTIGPDGRVSVVSPVAIDASAPSINLTAGAIVTIVAPSINLN